MASHCRCCSGHFIEDDVLGDCPGCPECADRDAQLYRLGDELAEAWAMGKPPSVDTRGIPGSNGSHRQPHRADDCGGEMNIPVDIFKCAELSAQIAALTAMLKRSVTVDVWQMTVREFEKTIARLTAERESAEHEIIDQREAIGHYQTEIATLTAERDDLQAKLETAHEDVRVLVKVAQQLQICIHFEATGSDGRWANRHLLTREAFQAATGAIARPTVRTIVEGP